MSDVILYMNTLRYIVSYTCFYTDSTQITVNIGSDPGKSPLSVYNVANVGGYRFWIWLGSKNSEFRICVYIANTGWYRFLIRLRRWKILSYLRIRRQMWGFACWLGYGKLQTFKCISQQGYKTSIAAAKDTYFVFFPYPNKYGNRRMSDFRSITNRICPYLIASLKDKAKYGPGFDCIRTHFAQRFLTISSFSTSMWFFSVNN